MSESNTRAGLIVTAAVVLALAGAAAWSASTLADAKQAAADAAADTASCRQLAGQIAAQRRAPATTGPSAEDIGPRLERAMAAADVDADSLARVAPQPPHRIGQSAYARRSTQIALRLVTLRQALSFVAALAGDPRSGLSLESFRLTVPAADAGATPAASAGDDDWDAELSVSQAVKVSGKGDAP